MIRRRQAEATRVVLSTGLVSLVALLFPTVSVTGAFSYAAVLYFWLGSTGAILALRALVRSLVPIQESSRARDALIVGTGPRAQRLAQELHAAGAERFHVVGFVDSADHRPPSADRDSYLGSLDQVEHILMRSAVDEVLITLPIKSAYADIQAVLECCERVGVPARYLADLFEPTNGRTAREADQPSLVQTPLAPEGWGLVTKRMIDLVELGRGAAAAGPGAADRGDRGQAHQPRTGPVRPGALRATIAGCSGCTSSGRWSPAPRRLQGDLEQRNEASGPVFKIREDPRVTRGGQVPAADVDRRAAPADQRAARRDVAGRPPAAADPGRAPLHRGGADAALQRPAGPHRACGRSAGATTSASTTGSGWT